MSLSNELWWEIFSRINHLQSIISCSVVCKTWRNLILDSNYCWNSIILSSKESRLYYNLLQTPNIVFTNIVNLHTLDLSHTNITDVSALGNLHTLKLSGSNITDVSALGNVRILR